MNKKQREDYVATYNQFSLEAPHVPGGEMRDLLDKLHRAETTLHRIAEMVCSVEMSEAEEARLQRKDNATEKRVEKIAERLGFKVRFNGDPRGGAIRFLLPSKRSNNWDGETWGIYW